MFICFMCSIEKANHQDLIHHYKTSHNLGHNSIYRCAQSNCFRAFQSLRSFRRHIVSHNVSDRNIYSELAPSLNFNTDNMIENYNNLDITDNTQDPCNVNACCSNLQPTSESFSKKNENVRKSTAAFALSLYSNPYLNRKCAMKIIDDVSELVTGVIGTMLSELSPNDDTPNKNIVEAISNSFDGLDTESKVIKYFSDRNIYTPPKKFTINENVTVNTGNSTVMLRPMLETGAIVPLRAVLKQIFELPNFLKCSTSIPDVQSISNFTQGNIWKQKLVGKMDENSLYIPYFLYFDDFECNNPLGSHAGIHSIAATYYTFPTLSADHASLLENIFVAMLHKSSSKSHGNASIYYELIKELKSLEQNGIDLEISEGVSKVYFILGMIIGDNLGLNTVLGFAKSFSSNYYCRICKAHKNIMGKQCKQDDGLMRNRHNYNTDVEINNVTTTGISERCVFNDISTFHVVDNFCVDIMHDIFEGVCHYDLTHIIVYFTESITLFTLNNLNNRLQLFDYGSGELNDRCGIIKHEHLMKSKFNMSASEMMLFVHIFPLLVGDLIPEDDEVWQFFLTLLEIIDILLCRDIDNSTLLYLEALISEHHESYVKLFHDTLKPKHHFMVHYPHVIKQVGPLRLIWCMRFEAKHKQLKRTASLITSRKNLPLTLLIKEQLTLAHRLYTGKGCETRIELGTRISEPLNIHDYLKDVIISDDVNLANSLNWVYYNGIKYVPGMILVISNRTCYNFFKIKFICVSSSSNNIYFLTEQIDCIGFNYHLQAHQLHQRETGLYRLIMPQDLIYAPTFCHIISNGDSYCRIKYI
ncbi:uncharacterized protein LOC134675033 [Cydia fagiglandana]|uniref:uncharacterized protein LOC134675033 n=1 Tax=Cydia fagiglandana TaxID=1458189 RepID=UPI002FEE45AE